MTTLVTGATGFVGAAVARCLIASGRRVRALVRETSVRRNLVGLDAEIVTGDLRDQASLEPALAGCDELFHVAADYRLWIPDPANLYAVNVEGTRSLMRAARRAGIERLVYTSSVATLGTNPHGPPADEGTPVALSDMIGHYKRSKYQAEELVRSMVGEGLPAVIVNPSTPVGPGDVKPTPTGRMIRDAAAGRIPAFVDTGLNIVHVDDVARGHLLALERGKVGERYILGGHDLTLEQILHEIAAITGRRGPRVRLPHAAVLPIAYLAEGWARIVGRGEPLATVDAVRMSRKRMFFSSAKAERELGYAYRDAGQALADAVAWFERG